MFSLILVVLLGLGIALFAQQNTQTVQVAVGSYFFSAVPVYLIVLASMLFGLVLAWILSIMNFFSASHVLRQKESALHDSQKRVASLEDEVQTLREENAHLKGEEVTVTRTEPTFWERLRERFTPERREAIS